jgi:hypothetical protein
MFRDRVAASASEPTRDAAGGRSPLRGLAGFVSAGASHHHQAGGAAGRRWLVLGGIVHRQREPSDFTAGPEPSDRRLGASHRGPGASQGDGHGELLCSILPRALCGQNVFIKRVRDAGEPAQRRLENRRSVTGARRFRGGRGRWGRGPDLGGILPGSWPEPSGKVAGTWRDGSRTVRGRFKGFLAAEPPDDSQTSPLTSVKTPHRLAWEV